MKAVIGSIVFLCLWLFVIAQDDIDDCPYHKAFCDAISSKDGHENYWKCFDESAPQYMKDIASICMNQLGETTISIKQYWEKVCDKDNKEMAKKRKMCMQDEFTKLDEKNPNFLDQMEGFVKCVGRIYLKKKYLPNSAKN